MITKRLPNNLYLHLNGELFCSCHDATSFTDFILKSLLSPNCNNIHQFGLKSFGPAICSQTDLRRTEDARQLRFGFHSITTPHAPLCTCSRLDGRAGHGSCSQWNGRVGVTRRNANHLWIVQTGHNPQPMVPTNTPTDHTWHSVSYSWTSNSIHDPHDCLFFKFTIRMSSSLLSPPLST